MAAPSPNRVLELNEQDWRQLSAAIERLEFDWRSGKAESLGQYGFPVGHALRTNSLIELIKVDQELRWRAGQKRPLESYLDDWPELGGDQVAVRELLNAELLTRAVFGDLPTLEDVRLRFPNLVDQVDWEGVHARFQDERSSTERTQSVADVDTADSGRGASGDRRADARRSNPASQQSAMPPPGEQQLRVGGMLDRYEIRELLGWGGMGAVYRAYDTELHREVALKTPRFDPLTEPAIIERFVREARAAAAVRHPNICPIYDIGETGGKHYITMAMVNGDSIRDRLARCPPPAGATSGAAREMAQPGGFSPREAAQMVRKLAQALAAIHAAGVLHRDVNAGNVMIDERGEPVLLDFGLAREVVIGEKHLTSAGSLLGTPAYMSPEQVRSAAEVDERSDIYSLGVVMYQLLTGQLPFTGTLPRVLVDIENADPHRPRSLRPEMDERLEQICLKALEKNPADRFQTAAEFATALEEYERTPWRAAGVSPPVEPDTRPDPFRSPHSDDSPTTGGLTAAARRVEPGTRPPVRNRRPLLLGAALLAACFAAILIYINTGEGRLELSVNEPDIQVRLDGQPQRVEITSPRDTITIKVPAGRHELEVTKDGFTAFMKEFRIIRNGRTELTARLTPLKDTGQQDLTNRKPAASSTAQPSPAGGGVAGSTGGPDIGRVPGSTGGLTPAARLAALTRRVQGVSSTNPADDAVTGLRAELLKFRNEQPGTAEALEAAKLMTQLQWPVDALRREEIPEVELRAAGGGDPQQAPAELVAVLGDSRLHHWYNVTSLVFTRDGRTLISGSYDGTVCEWDAGTGELRKRIAFFREVHSVQLTPDENGLIVGDWESPCIKIFDRETGRQRRPPLDGGHYLALSPDGKTIAAGYHPELQVFDVESGERRHSVKGHTAEIMAVAFSPNGETVATASWDHTARLWNAATGEPGPELTGHSDKVNAVASSPDAKRLATGSNDKTVRLWNSATGQQISVFDRETATVSSLTFSPDGCRLVAGDWSGFASMFDLQPHTVLRRFVSRDRNNVTALAFSFDGAILATGHKSGAIQLWNVATGELRFPARYHDGFVSDAALSPDARTVATAAFDGTVKLWNLLTGEVTRTLPVSENAAVCVAFSPDGRFLATGNRPEYRVRLWHADTGEFVRDVRQHRNVVHDLAFLPDGVRLLSSSSHGGIVGGLVGSLVLSDVSSGALLRRYENPDQQVVCVAVSPDGDALASARLSSKTVQVWDTASGELRHTLTGHTGAVIAVAFSPDGHFLATGDSWGENDVTVRIWDVSTGEERRVLRGHRNSVDSVAFSPDGQSLWSSAGDGTVRKWDPFAGPGVPMLKRTLTIGPAVGMVDQLIPTPDGRHLITRNRNGTLYVLRVNDRR